MQPLLHVVERVCVSHVIDHNDAVRPPVVAACDGPEPLLTSRVPDLQLDRLPVQVDRTDFLRRQGSLSLDSAVPGAHGRGQLTKSTPMVLM